MLNITKGTIEYIVMQSGGVLGLGEKLFAIPIQVLHLNAEKEVFILNQDREYLKNAPGFDKEHWPKANTSFIEQVSHYWKGNKAPVTTHESTLPLLRQYTGIRQHQLQIPLLFIKTFQ